MTNDARSRVATWRQLLDPDSAELIALVREMDAPNSAALARLRRRWSFDLVDAAIELVRARARAAKKFPGRERLMADVEGVEQATSIAVAMHKATRFASLPAGRGVIHDLCCGIGGDTMALASLGDVVAIDRNPLRAWMAEHNAGCAARVADVESLPLDGVAFHLDPSRRIEGAGAARRHHYDDYEPGPAFIERLLSGNPDGAIKLGPGVDFSLLPLDGDRELEIVNEGGALVQTVLWCGRLAVHPGLRTATRIPGGASFTNRPAEATGEPVDGFLDYLLVADPAIERAGLIGPLCEGTPVRPIYPGLGLLTTAEAVVSPWFAAYEVIAAMPWRPKKIRSWLRAADAGIVTVKTRGGAVDATRMQRDLRGDGDEPYTVFGLRLGQRICAAITRPVAAPTPAAPSTRASASIGLPPGALPSAE